MLRAIGIRSISTSPTTKPASEDVTSTVATEDPTTWITSVSPCSAISKFFTVFVPKEARAVLSATTTPSFETVTL